MTSSAAASLNPAGLPRSNSARSAGQVSESSAFTRGARSGPVDLDETQNSVDSVETNPSASNGVEAIEAFHEQNGSIQNIPGARTAANSSMSSAGSDLRASAPSARGVAAAAGHPGSTDVIMQNLLEDMTKHFDQMGQTILGRIDNMGSRIDDMERTIGDLMGQAGLEPSIGTIPAASLAEDTIGEQDAESTASV